MLVLLRLFGSCFPLKMSTKLKVRSSDSAFCRSYQRIRGSRSLDELVEVIVFTFNTFVFRWLYIMLHQLCFPHMLNYPVIYSLSERESSSKHARNYVYLSKIEIVPTIKNLICRCLPLIVRCDLVNNYVSKRFITGKKWLDWNIGK